MTRLVVVLATVFTGFSASAIVRKIPGSGTQTYYCGALLYQGKGANEIPEKVIHYLVAFSDGSAYLSQSSTSRPATPGSKMKQIVNLKLNSVYILGDLRVVSKKFEGHSAVRIEKISNNDWTADCNLQKPAR